MEDIQTKRRAMIESYFLVSISFFILLVVIYLYRLYPWYYFTTGLYFALSYIPESIRGVLFFWTSDNQYLVGPMSKDLLHHWNDFDTHYVDDAVGSKKFKNINFLAFSMFYPYLGLLFIRNVVVYYRGVVGVRHPNQLSVSSKNMVYVPKAYQKEKSRNKMGAMQAFVHSQSLVWPYVNPIKNIMTEMIKNPNLDAEWYAMSPIPEQWLIERDLVPVVSRKSRRALLTKSERQLISLDMNRTYTHLRNDLGPLFVGSFAGMPFVWRAAVAVFILQIFGQIGPSRRLNRQLCYLYEVNPDALSKERIEALRPLVEEQVNSTFEKYEQYIQVADFDETKFDDPFDPFLRSFNEVNSEVELLNSGKDALKEVFTRHAYRSTVVMGLMVASWRYGVLASAEMLWVKTVDRELWYLISQCGRKSCLMGALSPWSHFLGEVSANCRLIVPQMAPALRSLDLTMWNSHDNYTPHEQFEMSADVDSKIGGVGSAISVSGDRNYTEF